MSYNFSTHYIKIRKVSGKLWLEVWETYTFILKLQVPLSHYKYNIDGEEFNVTRK